jgi:hypothetical protein
VILEIKKYRITNSQEWDSFMHSYGQGCFLFLRDFMDYHQDRFLDFSLMMYADSELVACIPAQMSDYKHISHGGLTFGGLIARSDYIDITGLLESLQAYLKVHGFNQSYFKAAPFYYFGSLHKSFQDAGYTILEKDHDYYIDLAQEWQPSPKKTAGYRNGKFDKLHLVTDNDYAYFWEHILVPRLKSKHHANPVHTIPEIQLLHDRFPDRIQLTHVELNGKRVAGMVTFDFGNTLKVQYAASTTTGFSFNAMEYLYLEKIATARGNGARFVDLGTVDNPGGGVNPGLARFKQQLGAIETRTHRYELDLRHELQ